MSHEEFMRLAIAAARKSEGDGGVAIGAVIAKEGKVIASAGSTTWINRDPSGHAETSCIRNACKALDATNLDGCVLYGTLEPCGMCLSCSVWARLKAVYFGAYREDVAGNAYEIDDWSAEEIAKKTRLSTGERLVVQGGILREECATLFSSYKDWHKQNSPGI
jgi:tRNA(Arg) A34 adenosine deaminase TadA